MQVRAKNGFDKYGRPTLGASSTIRARFVEKSKLMKNEQGEEYMTDAELWLLPTQTINLEDTVIYSSTNYKVAKIEVRRDVNGDVDHKKAFLIKTQE